MALVKFNQKLHNQMTELLADDKMCVACVFDFEHLLNELIKSQIKIIYLNKVTH